MAASTDPVMSKVWAVSIHSGLIQLLKDGLSVVKCLDSTVQSKTRTEGPLNLP